MTVSNLNFNYNELDKRYRLLAKIGKGGMGDVYLATQKGAVDFSRLVVVKRIHERFHQASSEQLRMFINEASLIASLNHPHIVKIIDFCTSGDAVSMVMEYVEGETLKYVLSTCNRMKIRIPFGVSARLIIDACDAVHYAHASLSPAGDARTVIHRDLGLHNLMLDSNGYLKVIDFGIAKSSTGSDMTTPGLVKGTPGYMAPDLFSSEVPDHRIDIYALGLCLYELATQERAFRFEKNVNFGKVMNEINSRELLAPSKIKPDIPDGIDEIVSKAIEKDRELRYQTVDAFANELKKAVADQLYSDGEVKKWFTDVFAERLSERRAFGARLLESQPELDETQLESLRTGGQSVDSAWMDEGWGSSSIRNTSPSVNGTTQLVIDRSTAYKMTAMLLFGLLGVGVILYFLLAPEKLSPPVTGTPAAEIDAHNLLVFSTPIDAEVSIDGKAQGVIGKDGLELQVSTDRKHTLVVSKDGYQDFSLEFEGQEKGQKRVFASLLPVAANDVTDKGISEQSQHSKTHEISDESIADIEQPKRTKNWPARSSRRSSRRADAATSRKSDADSSAGAETLGAGSLSLSDDTNSRPWPSTAKPWSTKPVDNIGEHLSDDGRKIPLPDEDVGRHTPIVR